MAAHRDSHLPLLLLGLALTAVSGCAHIPRSYVSGLDRSVDTSFAMVEGSPLYHLIPRGWIAPVDRPRFATVDRAAAFMKDEEPVMVVVRGDDVRIYSTWYLDGHEVVNDVVGGEALAVTWCPLVQAGVVFSRVIDIGGEPTPLRLQASGKLWRDALVMFDRETHSLWTQHDGRAIQGNARDGGRVLAVVPSVTTSWAEAKARHPNAQVLRKPEDLLGRGQRTIYDGYLARTDQLGIFGTHLADDALPGKALVLGFVRPEASYALSMDGLVERRAAAISVGGDPVFAHALPGGKDGRVWHRAVPGRKRLLALSLSEDGRTLEDGSLGAIWDAFDGTLKSGPQGLPNLRGESTKVLFWFAWHQNHPASRVWAGQTPTEAQALPDPLAGEDDAELAPEPEGLQHYVFFGRDRERIREPSFLNNDGVAGAQLKYTWKELEPYPDTYDMRPILRDLAFLASHGKALFVQIQDVSFDDTILVPRYLIDEPEFGGGVAPQYVAPGEVPEGLEGTDGIDPAEPASAGWVARRWDPAVRARFSTMLRVMGRELDGKIAGLNLPETAVEIAEDPALQPEGFTYEGYVSAIEETMTMARWAFPTTRIIQYANFMPGEWLPEEDAGYLRRVYAHAEAIGVGVGGPDLMPYRPGQRAHSYPLIAARTEGVVAGLAVQDGNLADINPTTGEPVTAAELEGFARTYLHLDFVFWGTEEPYYSRDVLPLLSVRAWEAALD